VVPTEQGEKTPFVRVPKGGKEEEGRFQGLKKGGEGKKMSLRRREESEERNQWNTSEKRTSCQARRGKKNGRSRHCMRQGVGKRGGETPMEEEDIEEGRRAADNKKKARMLSSGGRKKKQEPYIAPR